LVVALKVWLVGPARITGAWSSMTASVRVQVLTLVAAIARREGNNVVAQAQHRSWRRVLDYHDRTGKRR